MKLMKCPNNHFYDGDIYSKCPHCKEDVDDPKTEKLDRSHILFGKKEKQNASDELWESLGQDIVQPASQTSEQKEDLEIPTDDLRSAIENLNVTEKLDRSCDKFNDYENRVPTGIGSVKSVPDDEGKTVRFSSRQEDAKEPLVGWLVGLNGEVYGESFPLVTGRNYIGRGADMDVVLRGDPSVSRNKHAIIIYDPKGRQFLLQPGESKELFYMDDKVVLDTQTMTSGCTLCIGETRLRFVAFCGEDFSWETNS